MCRGQLYPHNGQLLAEWPLAAAAAAEEAAPCVGSTEGSPPAAASAKGRGGRPSTTLGGGGGGGAAARAQSESGGRGPLSSKSVYSPPPRLLPAQARCRRALLHERSRRGGGSGHRGRRRRSLKSGRHALRHRLVRGAQRRHDVRCGRAGGCIQRQHHQRFGSLPAHAWHVQHPRLKGDAGLAAGHLNRAPSVCQAAADAGGDGPRLRGGNSGATCAEGPAPACLGGDQGGSCFSPLANGCNLILITFAAARLSRLEGDASVSPLGPGPVLHAGLSQRQAHSSALNTACTANAIMAHQRSQRNRRVRRYPCICISRTRIVAAEVRIGRRRQCLEGTRTSSA